MGNLLHSRIISKQRVIAFCMVFLTVLFASNILFIDRASAQLPFGGRALFVHPCTCSPGVVVVVGPPVPGAFLYLPPLSIPFLWYQIPRVGPWLLGTYTPGATCLIWVGKACVPSPTFPIGTIRIVGTSL